MKDIIEIGRPYGDLIAVARTGSGCWHTTCSNNHEVKHTLTKRVKAGVCHACEKEKVFAPGRIFGRLTIVERLNGHSRCQCECGNETVVRNFNLAAGHTQSCGCGRIGPRKRSRTDERATLYRVWANVRQRTSNASNPEWKYYGGRGIENHLGKYETFRLWALNSGYEHGLTLDRRNNNGHYQYNNLRWVTYAVQAQNTSRTVLNPALVRRIRRLAEQGLKAKAIHRLLGIGSLSTIKNVLAGKTWRDIA